MLVQTQVDVYRSELYVLLDIHVTFEPALCKTIFWSLSLCFSMISSLSKYGRNVMKDKLFVRLQNSINQNLGTELLYCALYSIFRRLFLFICFVALHNIDDVKADEFIDLSQTCSFFVRQWASRC